MAKKTISYALKWGVMLPAMTLALASFAANSVNGNIEAYLVDSDSSGVEVIAPADQAEPGDVIEYRLTFTNSGETDVFGLNVVNPIPQNTLFVSESASTRVQATFKVSIDGGETFEPTPVVRIETQADGTQKRVVIPSSQYTHVQWRADQPLKSSGGEHLYAYRVLVK